MLFKHFELFTYTAGNLLLQYFFCRIRFFKTTVNTRSEQLITDVYPNVCSIELY